MKAAWPRGGGMSRTLSPALLDAQGTLCCGETCRSAQGGQGARGTKAFDLSTQALWASLSARVLECVYLGVFQRHIVDLQVEVRDAVPFLPGGSFASLGRGVK